MTHRRRTNRRALMYGAPSKRDYADAGVRIARARDACRAADIDPDDVYNVRRMLATDEGNVRTTSHDSMVYGA
jgi:hypothetical protein